MSLQSLMYYQHDVCFGMVFLLQRWAVLVAAHFVTWQTQHKGTARAHTADDINPLFTRNFVRLTCVERIIKCTGNCK